MNTIKFGNLLPGFLLFLYSITSCAQKPPVYNPADRSWVKAANDRIEKYRKADLNIKVIDKNGKPVSNASVTIHQESSAFIFGSAVASKWLLSQNADGEKYRDIVKSHYNEVVLENDLKWNAWNNNPKSSANMQRTLKALHWLNDNNIKVRGHYLAWAPIKSFSYYGSSLTQQQYDNPAEYKTQLLDHIRDIITQTKGLITEWDAINHIVTTHQEGQINIPFSSKKMLLPDYVGNDIYSQVFRVAREAAPDETLFVNEQILPSDVTQSFNDTYFQKIKELQTQGLKVGGIGFMGHFKNTTLPSINNLHGIFEQFARLNIPIKVTEFDVRFGNKNQAYKQSAAELNLQAQFTEDFLRLAFSEPAVTGVVMWGFWEGSDWYPSAALYNKDWSVKPNGESWDKLVLHEWRTNLTANTNENGQVNASGFLGNYTVSVKTSDGKEIKKNISLDNKGLVVTVTTN
ncbi:endo-1,4-beta-xylanase [Parafilimonas sp.]|uniref:endo-1,4-beta-xylanase n=1 Tax=Parafilimonas sp. TaxID=1969739 RepID=UPI0039E4012F